MTYVRHLPSVSKSLAAKTSRTFKLVAESYDLPARCHRAVICSVRFFTTSTYHFYRKTSACTARIPDTKPGVARFLGFSRRLLYCATVSSLHLHCLGCPPPPRFQDRNREKRKLQVFTTAAVLRSRLPSMQLVGCRKSSARPKLQASSRCHQ